MKNKIVTINQIKKHLESLTPMEIVEACGLEEDPEGLVDALIDYIEENLDDVNSRLVVDGVIEEDED